MNKLYKKEKKTKYLLTIEKSQVKDHVFKHDLDELLFYLECEISSFICHEWVYELGSTYSQLHLHAIVEVDYKFRWKPYNYRDGYRIHWQQIYDQEGAKRYLYKQAYTKGAQEEILTLNDYRDYSFTD